MLSITEDEDVADVVACDGPGCSKWAEIIADPIDMPAGWVTVMEDGTLSTYCGWPCLQAKAREP